MNAAPAAPKRNRRIYILKGDDDIYREVAKYQFITAELLTEILGRDESTTRKRCLALYQARHLNRQRRDELAPYWYFLGEHGAKRAYELGYSPEPRFVKGKSKILINHDGEITLFHRALDVAFGNQVSQWEQWRGDLKDEIETDKGVFSLIPDGRFMLDDQFFFLEVVKSYESEYESGESNLMQKARLYASYRDGFRRKYEYKDFRVLWVLPTQARVLGFLAKLEQEFPYRRFYVTDEESYKTNFKGKIWWTPRDFREATYALDA